jgi:dTDP-4-amino-4,6-dideoxygalactose transaminase
MTFSATAHAIAWNGAEPVFAECNVDSYQLDVRDAAARVRSDTSVLMATHCFGAPADIEGTLAAGDAAGIPVVFDAAHGFGAERRGVRLGGFGAAEIFSLSPTKLVISGEGGLVATNDDALADTVAMGRDYGNPGNYDTQFVGLNARMSEIHAAIALCSFDQLEGVLAERRRIAARYRSAIEAIAGVSPQHIDEGDLSTFKDLSVTVDAPRFGIDRDRLGVVLKADGIDTRPYFYPAVHQQTAYRRPDGPSLPATDLAASRALSLPIYPGLTDDVIGRIVEVIAAAHASAEELAAAT